MSARLVLLVLMLLGLATPASAHRLDEYLQATTIRVARDRVDLELRLSPGVSVARGVLAGIDANGDGVLSHAEQGAYADKVRQDLALTIDGRPAPLTLTAAAFPARQAMLDGVGDIDLEFQAALASGPVVRDLDFQNRHQKAIAVYLVNTLLPDDPAVRVTGQSRSYDQSDYHLAFTTGAATGAAPAATDPSKASAGGVIEVFFWHGVRHILTGYDHLLFVAALVLGASTLWDLIKVVTAFTLAHSLTLTLAALGLVHLPPQVVEPLISASIVFVALQNLFWPQHARGASRLAAAFFFGLFHGLGFAGGLLDIMHQMPRQTLYLALVGFSLGVEAGNQLVLLPLFGALSAIRRLHAAPGARTNIYRALQRIGSAAISAAGLYYLCVALAAPS